MPLPVILKRVAIALCVFILGATGPRANGRLMRSRPAESGPSAIPRAPTLALELSPSLATFRFAKCNAALFTIRQKEALPFHVTQHTFALYFLPKAFQNPLLRLALPQCNGCQLDSPP
jgi:hypothetical protein